MTTFAIGSILVASAGCDDESPRSWLRRPPAAMRPLRQGRFWRRARHALLAVRLPVGTDPGLEALVYYFDSHPGMVAVARRVIGAAFESTDKRAQLTLFCLSPAALPWSGCCVRGDGRVVGPDPAGRRVALRDPVPLGVPSVRRHRRKKERRRAPESGNLNGQG
jgi:hypothetical protein